MRRAAASASTGPRCAITGRSRTEQPGGSVFDVLHSEDRDNDVNQYRQLVAGETDRYSIEKRIVRKDGSVIWVAVTCSSCAMPPASSTTVCGFSRTLPSARPPRRSCVKGSASFANYSKLCARRSYATDTRTGMSRSTMTPSSSCRVIGPSSEAPNRLPPVAVSDRTARRCRYDQNIHGGCAERRARAGCRAVAERPDGTRVPFIPYPTPLHDASGTLIGGINILVDVSERKQAETPQRVLLDELNHRVKNNMQTLQALLVRRSGNDSAEAQEVLADASQRIAAMAAAQRVLYDADHPTNYATPRILSRRVRTIVGKTIDIAWEPAISELPNDTAMPLALILNELLTNAAKHGAKGREGASIKVGLTRSSDAFVLSPPPRGWLRSEGGPQALVGDGLGDWLARQRRNFQC